MQIVINIDDEDYKRIQDISDVFNSLTSRTYSAIRNGTPLEQEPCEDAISRQAVLDGIAELKKSPWFNDNTNWAKFIRKEAVEIVEALCVKSLPSVNPQEPKTGHWITQWNVAHQKEYYYCSECREEFSYDGETGIKMNDYRYCPNCGIKMGEPTGAERSEE